MSTNHNLKGSGAVKKQLVRNIHVPLTKQKLVQKHCGQSRASSIFKPPDPGVEPARVGIRWQKYARPELQSSLGLARTIEKIKSAPIPKSKSVGDLTPRSQAFVIEHVSFVCSLPVPT